MAYSYSDLKQQTGDHILAQVADMKARQDATLKDIRWKIAVASGKGGVGKSAVTAGLALALRRLGAAVAVMDADLNGPSQGAMLRPAQPARLTAQNIVPATAGQGGNPIALVGMDAFVEGDENPVRWRDVGGLAGESYVWRGLTEARALQNFMADTAWGRRDVLLVDLPPGTDRIEEFHRLLPELDGLLLVGIPSPVAAGVVARSLTLCKQRNLPLLGLVENMGDVACPGCGERSPLFRHGEGLAGLAQRHGAPFLGGVPFDHGFSRLLENGGDPFETPGPAAAALLTLAQGLNDVLLRAFS